MCRIFMKTIDECLAIALQTPYAYGGPLAKGILRQYAEDYIVDELPLVEPDGSGEHVWLKIRKRHNNTDFVAKQLQKLAGVKSMAVSYAGMKDRHALTTQWFSVHLPTKDEPDWQSIASDEIEILEVKRHAKKCRRGTLSGNHFTIQVRDVEVDNQILMHRVEAIKTGGVPNFFSRQRFGRGGNNLNNAIAMFEGKKKIKRHQRAIYLSAARSLLFNYILSERVTGGNWSSLQVGDICLRTGRRGFFPVDELDEELTQRLHAGEIHPTAPLWGQGKLPVSNEIKILEEQLPVEFPHWCEGLEKAGLKMERRALRLVPQDFKVEQNDAGVKLSFSLPPGCYATSVIRELFDAEHYNRFSKT